MRKIKTQNEIEKTQKRNSRIFVYFILGILVLSSLGYAFFSNPGDTGGNSNLNNGQVQNLGNQWAFLYGDQVHYLSSSPESAKNVDIQITQSLGNYAGQNVYIVSENPGINDEIVRNLERYTAKIQEACYEDCNKDLPEKTCEDYLIIWRESETNRVYQENKCVFIEGGIVSADAFLYKIFGIN